MPRSGATAQRDVAVLLRRFDVQRAAVQHQHAAVVRRTRSAWRGRRSRRGCRAPAPSRRGRRWRGSSAPPPARSGRRRPRPGRSARRCRCAAPGPRPAVAQLVRDFEGAGVAAAHAGEARRVVAGAWRLPGAACASRASAQLRRRQQRQRAERPPPRRSGSRAGDGAVHAEFAIVAFHVSSCLQLVGRSLTRVPPRGRARSPSR